MYSIQLTQPDETQTRNASYPKYKHLRFDANNRLKPDIETDRDRSNSELQADGHRSQQSKLREKMIKYYNFYFYGRGLMGNYSCERISIIIAFECETGWHGIQEVFHLRRLLVYNFLIIHEESFYTVFLGIHARPADRRWRPDLTLLGQLLIILVTFATDLLTFAIASLTIFARCLALAFTIATIARQLLAFALAGRFYSFCAATAHFLIFL